MIELLNITKEQFKHKTQIFKLTIYNVKSEYANHYLGVFWNIFQPILQILVYYLVFGLGLRGSNSKVVNDVPFLIYLITGLFPWLFISQSINSGASAILKNLGLLSKMKFPPSVFLSISLTNNVFNLLFTTVIIFLISFVNNLVPWWHFFYFFYFLFSAFILVYGISLITSTLVVIIRDTKNLLQNIIRMLFFATPILWAIDESHGVLKLLINLNPFGYLIEFYRLAFIYEDLSSYDAWHDHTYFWILTLLILFSGSIIHYRFKHKFVDYI